MDFTKISKALENSPEEIKNILFSEEIGKFLSELAEKNKLDEETSMKMTDEVGYIILGLKERSSLKSSLADMNIPTNISFSIIAEINRKIFNELDRIDMKLQTDNPQDQSSNPDIKSDIHPMIEPGEIAHEVPHVEQTTNPSTVLGASNQEPITKPELPQPTIPKHDYPEGRDPYREPLK